MRHIPSCQEQSGKSSSFFCGLQLWKRNAALFAFLPFLSLYFVRSHFRENEVAHRRAYSERQIWTLAVRTEQSWKGNIASSWLVSQCCSHYTESVSKLCSHDAMYPGNASIIRDGYLACCFLARYKQHNRSHRGTSNMALNDRPLSFSDPKLCEMWKSNITCNALYLSHLRALWQENGGWITQLGMISRDLFSYFTGFYLDG